MREDKAQHYKLIAKMFPIARTPMDKKSASSLQSYGKSVDKMIDSMTPWTRKQHNHLAGLRENLRSGEAMVILGEGESVANLPIFEGMKVVKE